MSDFYRRAAAPSLALIGFILALSATAASAQTRPEAPGASAPSAEEATATPSLPDAAPIAERSLGQAEAPIRIDVYSSFVCTECAAWYLQVLPQLEARQLDAGRARLVYHDVVLEPLYHSARSAMIGLCTPPAKFFEVAQAFMSGLETASGSVENNAEWYDKAIAASGRDAAEMEACATSEPVYNQLQVENADPVIATLKNLPAILVNGQRIEDRSFDAISEAIDAALATSQAAADPTPPADS